MKKILVLAFALALAMDGMAQFSSAPAFPGAEGYGRFVTGGRGGTVVHVTNLNDKGTGSLRQALESTSGKRIVVFDVSGTIELNSTLAVKKGDVTVLGQTAPGDGICIRNYGVQIKANNVILRFLRFRMGDTAKAEADALGMITHNDPGYKNILIDHCSLCWSTDECGSFYGIDYFTMQWCILSESLKISVHDKGSHGYGGIWGGRNATYHHNLLAHHDSRNPRLDHGYVSTMGGPLEIMNNVIYNWGGNSCYGGENKPGYPAKTYNYMNNYYKPGPATKSGVKTRILDPTTYCTNCGSNGSCVPGKFYLTGNYMYGSTSVTSNNWLGSTHQDDSLKSSTRFTSGVEKYDTIVKMNLQSAETAFDKVMDCAGASYKRDSYDTRIINETRTGTYTYKGSMGSTGGLIDSQADVGGWPEYKSATKPKDSDNDGMPDDWEIANGLNPNSSSDASTYTIDSKKYYTNIEVYANWLVEDIMKKGREDAEESFEEYYPEVSDPTGINEVTLSPVISKKDVYNLQGQKVGSNYKGIVIYEGKKYLVK